MKKLLTLLLVLSLGVFTVGCQSEPAVDSGVEPEAQSVDTDPGAGEDLGDTEPAAGETGDAGQIDLDPGAGEDIGDTEPGENQ